MLINWLYKPKTQDYQNSCKIFSHSSSEIPITYTKIYYNSLISINSSRITIIAFLKKYKNIIISILKHIKIRYNFSNKSIIK